MESGNNRLVRYLDKDKTIAKAKTKTKTDLIVRSLLFLLAVISASAVIFIVAFIAVQGLKPFFTTYQIDGVEVKVSFWHFLTGMAWTENGSTGFGAGYIIINTIYIALLTILLTAPISIMTALVIVKMSPKIVGGILNAIIEILASVPSVIYGMFGQAWVTKMVKGMSEGFGFQSAGGLSTLAVC